MNLKFTEKKRDVKRSMYVVKLTFVVGDADYFPDQRFAFDEGRLRDDKFVELFYDFIRVQRKCIDLDSRGRQGIDDEGKLIRRYRVIDGWERFIDVEHMGDEAREAMLDYYDEPLPEKNAFSYEIPMDPNADFYGAYHSLTVTYYDEHGKEFNVSVEDD